MPRSFLVKKAKFVTTSLSKGAEQAKITHLQHSPTKYWPADHRYPDVHNIPKEYLVNLHSSIARATSFYGEFTITIFRQEPKYQFYQK